MFGASLGRAAVVLPLRFLILLYVAVFVLGLLAIANIIVAMVEVRVLRRFYERHVHEADQPPRQKWKDSHARKKSYGERVHQGG